ncbi:hypothetical protein TARUN_4313 [Trichoderma arundinaceum]|uniref:Uncharacterized protein n=1 Tax=Trichoderma arundinaceum TaxID=490622 RepID=A0A395NPQ0_TRIAR|nr:hypothetical protein TARUN_4313 [Trichoderma arundinaceum]
MLSGSNGLCLWAFWVGPVDRGACRRAVMGTVFAADLDQGPTTIVVMASQSVQQHSDHDAIVNPSPARLTERGQENNLRLDSTRLKQGGY